MPQGPQPPDRLILSIMFRALGRVLSAPPPKRLEMKDSRGNVTEPSKKSGRHGSAEHCRCRCGGAQLSPLHGAGGQRSTTGPCWTPPSAHLPFAHLHLLLPLERPSLLAQMVKNLPAAQKTWVRSPGREDPLEKGMSTHSSSLAGGAWQDTTPGTAKSWTWLSS